MDAKKLKSFVKGAVKKETFGTNPFDPWSTKANIAESASLNQYLISRGINPQSLGMAAKVAHSKSLQFLKWKQQHMREEHDDVKKPMKKAVDETPKGSQTGQLTPEEVQVEDMGHYATKGEGGKTSFRRSELKKAQSAYKEIKTPRGPGSHNEEVELDENDRYADIEWNHQLGSFKSLEKKKHENMLSKMKSEIEKHLSTGKDAPHEKLQAYLTLKHKVSKMREDVGDPKAAVNADGLNTQVDRMQAERTKSARIIKNIYKNKKMVKEDLYDHEKEDKSVATYGKKPKHDKADDKDSKGENKPRAASVLSGGTTLTGQKRDTVEIDPMMRVRPGQPDPTKKEDKKDGKKDEKKKDK